jgi:hypothetical protein
MRSPARGKDDSLNIVQKQIVTSLRSLSKILEEFCIRSDLPKCERTGVAMLSVATSEASELHSEFQAALPT